MRSPWSGFMAVVGIGIAAASDASGLAKAPASPRRRTPAPSPPMPAGAFDWIHHIVASEGGIFILEAKTYYIDKQYQLPPNTEIHGAGSGGSNTVIKAVGDIRELICYENARNRKGFLLNDNTYIGKLHFIGMDQMRFKDNQLLCGGAPFETPGCAGTSRRFSAPPSKEDCHGTTGIGHGVENATVEDITIEGNTVQNAFFMPPTAVGERVSNDIKVLKITTNGTWADGVNLHGAHTNVAFKDLDISNTGDDVYAIWSVGSLANNISFLNCSAKNPRFRGGGSSRPGGRREKCFVAYGGKTLAFLNVTCVDGADGVVNLWQGFGGTFDSSSDVTVSGAHGPPRARTCTFKRFPGKSNCTAKLDTLQPFYI